MIESADDGKHSSRNDAGGSEAGADFPLTDVVLDHSGAPRSFTIQCEVGAFGYSLRARERRGSRHGYEFSAFDSSSPYVALGALRAKMRRALATRYLAPPGSGGGPTMLHDRLEGHIEYSSGDRGIRFVVDGHPLSLDDLGRLAATHEGFRFELRFVDPFDTSS